MVWTQWCKNFEDMFTNFDRKHERGRQTNGLTDRRTPHDGNLCIASRGKNPFFSDWNLETSCFTSSVQFEMQLNYKTLGDVAL